MTVEKAIVGRSYAMIATETKIVKSYVLVTNRSYV